MWLLSGTAELCGIEYLKMVFLKYLNVPTWSIFAGLVTIYLCLKTNIRLLKGNLNQGWRKVLRIGQAKPMKLQEQILTFVNGSR